MSNICSHALKTAAIAAAIALTAVGCGNDGNADDGSGGSADGFGLEVPPVETTPTTTAVPAADTTGTTASPADGVVPVGCDVALAAVTAEFDIIAAELSLAGGFGPELIRELDEAYAVAEASCGEQRLAEYAADASEYPAACNESVEGLAEKNFRLWKEYHELVGEKHAEAKAAVDRDDYAAVRENWVTVRNAEVRILSGDRVAQYRIVELYVDGTCPIVDTAGYVYFTQIPYAKAVLPHALKAERQKNELQGWADG